MKHKTKLGIFALGLLAITSTGAQAANQAASQAASSFAGVAFGSPIAFGADWGSAGIGIYGQTLDKDLTGEDGDGSMGVAFGLGDADRYVGLETVVSISSITGNSGDSFGEAGGLGFKLHTNIGHGAAFAVGVLGTGRWGNAADANRSSVYAVATKVFQIGSTSPRALVVNVGIGDEGFQQLDTNGFGEPGAGVFGSLAFFITPRISVIADYTGRFLNAGISAAPFRTLPLTITLGGVNLTDRYETDPQLAMTVGYGFHF